MKDSQEGYFLIEEYSVRKWREGGDTLIDEDLKNSQDPHLVILWGIEGYLTGQEYSDK